MEPRPKNARAVLGQADGETAPGKIDLEVVVAAPLDRRWRLAPARHATEPLSPDVEHPVALAGLQPLDDGAGRLVLHGVIGPRRNLPVDFLLLGHHGASRLPHFVVRRTPLSLGYEGVDSAGEPEPKSPPSPNDSRPPIEDRRLATPPWWRHAFDAARCGGFFPRNELAKPVNWVNLPRHPGRRQDPEPAMLRHSLGPFARAIGCIPAAPTVALVRPGTA